MIKNREMYGLYMVLIGAVLWGTLSVFVKYVNIDSYLFCMLRSLVASLALLPFILKGGYTFNRDLFAFVASYVLLGLLLVLSIRYTSNAIAIGMQFTAPLWVFIYDFIRGKRLSGKQYIPLVLILIGVLVFMLTPAEGSTWYGNLLALAAGILFGGLTIFSARVKTDNPIGMTGFANVIGFFVMLVCFLLLGDGWGQLAELGMTSWLALLAVGVFQTAGGFAFFNIGLRHVATQKASVASTLELVCSLIFVAVFIGEYPDVYGILGSALIIGGILIEVLIMSYEDKHALSGQVGNRV